MNNPAAASEEASPTAFASNRMIPEFAMLLASARTAPDAVRMNALIDSELHWQSFFDLASHHGVRPLVYRSLRAVCWNRLPAPAREKWQQTHQMLMGKSLFLAGELLRIANAFASAGIRLAVLKGAVIAQMAYGDFSLREFGDIDLLVAEADVSRAIELIEKGGYVRLWKLDNSRMLRFLCHMGEYKLTNDISGTEIDLHWRVAHRSVALSPQITDFPHGFRPVSIAGSSVLSFAPQDLPLYLSSQGGGDQWGDLRRICDLAEFTRCYPEVNWQPHLDTARRLGGLRSMLTGLVLACDLLGADMPEAALPEIRTDPEVHRLAGRALQQLQANISAGETTSRYAFQLRAKQGLPGKLSLAWKILGDRTALDGSWIMLPRPLWWAYPILRPLRVTARILRA